MDTSKLQGLLVENYEISSQQPIEGGFAYVYKGRHLKLQDNVALKVLKPKYAYETQWRNLFVKEAVNLRKVSHPNVVKVHDILDIGDRDTNHDMIVMEWINGKKLGDWRRENSQLDINLALKITKQICTAVQAIHRHQLAHHDITPLNIIISSEIEAKLIDFGLSWAVSHDEPTPYPKYGVCLYLAPEQLNQAPTKNLEADVFGLGATLYYLFTGSHYLLPNAYSNWMAYRSGGSFSGDISTNEIRSAILNEEPNFKTLKETIPANYFESIRNILRLMLLKSASDRATIDQVVEMFNNVRPLKITSLSQTQLQTDYREDSITGTPIKAPPHLAMWVAKQTGETIDFLLTEFDPIVNGRLTKKDLYLPPNNNVARIFVTDENQSTIYFDKSIYVQNQPFQLTFSIQEKLNTFILELVMNGTQGRVVASKGGYQSPSNIVSVVPSEIMFIIDDALGSRLSEIQNVIHEFSQQLRNEGHIASIGAIFYGEYEKYGISTPTSQPTEYYPLTDWGVRIVEILKNKAQTPPQYENKGFCGALECALAQLANNYSEIWHHQKSVKHIVLFGMSPPHPTTLERRHYELLDFTADEFNDLDWKVQIDALESQNIMLSSFWLEPSFEIKFRGVEEYARYVWSRFNVKGEFSAFSETTALNRLLDCIRTNNREPIKLSEPITLPMISPLYDPFS